MSKIVGIPGWKIGDNSFGATTTYLDFIKDAGFTPRIIMPDDTGFNYNGILLPGGLDVSPANYNEIPSFQTSNSDVFKEHFYRTKLGQIIENGIPIFGICLGMQQLCTYFGSKLTQHFQYHKQSSSRWETAHEIKIINTGVSYKNNPSVNSHHHQGLLLKDINNHLDVIAIAKNEQFAYDFNKEPLHDVSIVEAVRHKQYSIAGVQWHPEELYDFFAVNLFKDTINNVKKKTPKFE